MTSNPFASLNNRGAPASSLLSEADFAEVYAAAAFAWRFRLFFESSVTIAWAKLGVTDPVEVQAHFTAFLKGVRGWLEAAVFPPAYMYAHEVGPVLGLHTHFIIALRPSLTGELSKVGRVGFKRWLRDWQERRFGRDRPRAIRVRGPNQQQPWLHWLMIHYLMKGYDPTAIVQSAASAPDGRDVFIGDLLVFKWTSPGCVPLNRRFGISHSLGPDRRAIGAPTGMDYVLRATAPVDPFSSAERAEPVGYQLGPLVPQPFRSKYEDGVRDVRLLYPPEFLEGVSRLLR